MNFLRSQTYFCIPPSPRNLSSTRRKHLKQNTKHTVYSFLIKRCTVRSDHFQSSDRPTWAHVHRYEQRVVWGHVHLLEAFGCVFPSFLHLPLFCTVLAITYPYRLRLQTHWSVTGNVGSANETTGSCGSWLVEISSGIQYKYWETAILESSSVCTVNLMWLRNSFEDRFIGNETNYISELCGFLRILSSCINPL